jgi:hypothetical protein
MHNQLSFSLLTLVVFATLTCGSKDTIAQLRFPLTPIPHFVCWGGDKGEVCCGPYRYAGGSCGTSHCNAGLGCNIATNTYEQPCGHPGEVCCDGPDTIGFQGPNCASQSGRIYIDSTGNVVLRKPMCQDSVCDMTTRRCVTNCGANAGEPCCGPQPYLAVASCTKPTLVCRFASYSFERGTCEPCGGLWQIPCEVGESCRQGRERVDGSICEPCGGVDQLPCLQGERETCRPPLAVRGPGRRCTYPPPPPVPTTPSPVVVDPPGSPSCPLGTIFCGGRCVASDPQNCGSCGTACPVGAVCVGLQCVSDSACAQIGGGCVPDNQPGVHCCQGGPQLALCVWGTCRPCIPTGQVCPPFGPQICCDANKGPGFNYQCVLDPNSGEAVCGVPDTP